MWIYLPVYLCIVSLSLSLSLSFSLSLLCISPFVFVNQTNSVRLPIRLSLYYLNVNFLYLCSLWHWSVSLAYFFENFNLVNNFQQWVLQLSYCRMSASLVTKSLYWYRRDVCPWNGYYGGGGCISQNSTHFVGFLSFSLYFSVFLRMYILLLVVFIFFYLYSFKSRVGHFCSFSLWFFLSLSFSSPVCPSICLSICL